jgi:hypothetical protein
MDRTGDKTKVSAAVPIRHEQGAGRTDWHKAPQSGAADCPLCGRPGGTAFADDVWVCCLPLSPLPYFY